MIKNNKLQRNHLTTAVLFLVFNRLETVKIVFDAIRKAKPPRLYIASDGARNINDEDAKVNSIREYILSNIDWECEIKTLFRNQNLGCKFAIIDAINWFFKNEEMGIILEDDCFPAQSFFWFCEDMLKRYFSNTQIAAISGTNINTTTNIECDYFYSLMGGNWGWATWRRSWNNFLADIEPILTKNNLMIIRQNINNKKLFLGIKTLYNNEKKSMKNDAWDFQWLFIRLLYNQYTIVPKRNLVSNIGFGINSTHTSDERSPLSNIKSYEMSWPLRHPNKIELNIAYDKSFLKYFKPSTVDKIIFKFRRILHV